MNLSPDFFQSLPPGLSPQIPFNQQQSSQIKLCRNKLTLKANTNTHSASRNQSDPRDQQSHRYTLITNHHAPSYPVPHPGAATNKTFDFATIPVVAPATFNPHPPLYFQTVNENHSQNEEKEQSQEPQEDNEESEELPIKVPKLQSYLPPKMLKRLNRKYNKKRKNKRKQKRQKMVELGVDLKFNGKQMMSIPEEQSLASSIATSSSRGSNEKTMYHALPSNVQREQMQKSLVKLAQKSKVQNTSNKTPWENAKEIRARTAQKEKAQTMAFLKAQKRGKKAMRLQKQQKLSSQMDADMELMHQQTIKENLAKCQNIVDKAQNKTLQKELETKFEDLFRCIGEVGGGSNGISNGGSNGGSNNVFTENGIDDTVNGHSHYLNQDKVANRPLGVTGKQNIQNERKQHYHHQPQNEENKDNQDNRENEENEVPRMNAPVPQTKSQSTSKTCSPRKGAVLSNDNQVGDENQNANEVSNQNPNGTHSERLNPRNSNRNIAFSIPTAIPSVIPPQMRNDENQSNHEIHRDGDHQLNEDQNNQHHHSGVRVTRSRRIKIHKNKDGSTSVSESTSMASSVSVSPRKGIDSMDSVSGRTTDSELTEREQEQSDSEFTEQTGYSQQTTDCETTEMSDNEVDEDRVVVPKKWFESLLQQIRNGNSTAASSILSSPMNSKLGNIMNHGVDQVAMNRTWFEQLLRDVYSGNDGKQESVNSGDGQDAKDENGNTPNPEPMESVPPHHDHQEEEQKQIQNQQGAYQQSVSSRMINESQSRGTEANSIQSESPMKDMSTESSHHEDAYNFFFKRKKPISVLSEMMSETDDNDNDADDEYDANLRPSNLRKSVDSDLSQAESDSINIAETSRCMLMSVSQMLTCLQVESHLTECDSKCFHC